MRNDLHANLTVRIFTDRKCFGPGVAELLRRVRELHSLRAAAMSMNMAYSKAWTVLRTAQEGLGVKLLRVLHRRAERWRRDADGGGRAAARRLRGLLREAVLPTARLFSAETFAFYDTLTEEKPE